MSSHWTDDSSKLFKLQNFIIGLIIALGLSYVTYLYFSYRTVNTEWDTAFVSPRQYWAEVPEWKWKSVL